MSSKIQQRSKFLEQYKTNYYTQHKTQMHKLKFKPKFEPKKFKPKSIIENLNQKVENEFANSSGL